MAQQIPDEILYDVRLIERHIARGLLTREAVQARLAQATDLDQQADRIDIDQLAAATGARGRRPKAS